MCKVKESILAALDVGNRYGKIKTDEIRKEIIISWRKVSKENFNETEWNKNIDKIIYKNEYYIVGLTGKEGINHKNKGHYSVLQQSNMIKLLLLSKDMEERKIDEAIYKSISGTPYDDFEAFKEDYKKLLKTQEDDYERINVNGKEYKIRVDKVALTKQSACVILTLPDRKKENYLLWDWGGETLDVCYFVKGIMFKGQTFDFSLNRKFKELGNELNKYIEITRPKLNDAIFMKDMESLMMKGNYKGIRNINIANQEVEIIKHANNWFKKEIKNTALEVTNELDLNASELGSLKHIHIGGGAKLLKEIIPDVEMFVDSAIAEDSEFRNVEAYFEIAKKAKDENWY